MSKRASWPHAKRHKQIQSQYVPSISKQNTETYHTIPYPDKTQRINISSPKIIYPKRKWQYESNFISLSHAPSNNKHHRNLVPWNNRKKTPSMFPTCNKVTPLPYPSTLLLLLNPNKPLLSLPLLLPPPAFPNPAALPAAPSSTGPEVRTKLAKSPVGVWKSLAWKSFVAPAGLASNLFFLGAVVEADDGG